MHRLRMLAILRHLAVDLRLTAEEREAVEAAVRRITRRPPLPENIPQVLRGGS